MRDPRRLFALLAWAGALVATMALPSVSPAAIPASLKSGCFALQAAPGQPFMFCDDGTPTTAGRLPNNGAVSAVPVPAKYDGYEGLPSKAADAASVPGADANGDIALDVDISMPSTPPPPGGYPLIAMMHGCCAGTKRDWESSAADSSGERWHFSSGWFASRGYVVLTYTARGFRFLSRGSTGETQLDSRLYEINDFQHLAGQIADDPFFNVDPQRVVATGGSYGGGFAWLAATDPIWTSPGGKQMRLAAAAPRYGWTDIVYSLLPNGRHFHSPDRLPAFDGSDSTDPFGIPKESILFVLFATGQFGATFHGSIDQAFACLRSGDPFETNPLCTAVIRDVLPGFIDDRSAYYQNRFFERIATDPDYRVPIFNAGTFTDPLFTPVENLRMANRLRATVPGYPIKQYFGDYQHFTQNKAKEWGDICGADRHICRFADYPGGDFDATPAELQRIGVTTRLNRFIDHYAKPAANPSEPAPTFDDTAALQVCDQNAGPALPADEPGETFTATTFHGLAPNSLRLDLTGVQTTASDLEPNPHALRADPLDNTLNRQSKCVVETTAAGPGVATYESEPLERQATMIGGTRVTIDYNATAASLQLNSRLYDVFPDGTAVLVDRGVRRVEGASGSVEYQLHGNGWRFLPGHRVRIEIAQDDDPFLQSSNVASSATLTGVRLRMPVREQQPPVPEDFKNRAKFCKAERAFWGPDVFAQRYGTNRSGRNAFGKCVSGAGLEADARKSKR